jgi:hypothetical protein
MFQVAIFMGDQDCFQAARDHKARSADRNIAGADVGRIA